MQTIHPYDLYELIKGKDSVTATKDATPGHTVIEVNGLDYLLSLDVPYKTRIFGTPPQK